MSTRLFPWRSKPFEDEKKMIESLDSYRLYVLSQRGPLSFIVKRDGDKQKHIVSIGERQACTCHRDDRVCQHLLFVMVKVLKVSKDNPVVWQLSLIDREIGDILAGKYAPKRKRQRKETSTSNAKTKVEKRQISSGEPCPICYNEMEEGGEPIAFCDAKCGRGIHAKCMQVWAQHRAEEKDPISCPLCRADWGSDAFQKIARVIQTWSASPDSDSKDKDDTMPKSVTQAKPTCSKCKRRIFYQRFRCVICENHNLCQSCYHSFQQKRKKKEKHVFVKRKEDYKSHQGPDVPGAWTAVRPKTRDQNLALELHRMQLRDITTSDYDLLLRLDRGSGEIPAYKFLAWHVLPSVPPDNDLECHLCSLKLEKNAQDSIKELPCTHKVHARCLLGELMYDLAKKCGICEQTVFPGLLPANLLKASKRRRAKPPGTKSLGGEKNLNKNKLGCVDKLGVGIQCVSVQGHAVSSPSLVSTSANASLGQGARNQFPGLTRRAASAMRNRRRSKAASANRTQSAVSLPPISRSRITKGSVASRRRGSRKEEKDAPSMRVGGLGSVPRHCNGTRLSGRNRRGSTKRQGLHALNRGGAFTSAQRLLETHLSLSDFHSLFVRMPCAHHDSVSPHPTKLGLQRPQRDIKSQDRSSDSGIAIFGQAVSEEKTRR